MSKSCGRVCDNKHGDCPARMSDGRLMTDYRPRCQVNFEAQPNPMSSYEYRQFLTHNAARLMQQNRDTAFQNAYCGPCLDEPGTMLPEQHKQVCNGRTCSFPVNDPNGVGLGKVLGGEQATYRPHDTGARPHCQL
jgi:hypothetical protein